MWHKLRQCAWEWDDTDKPLQITRATRAATNNISVIADVIVLPRSNAIDNILSYTKTCTNTENWEDVCLCVRWNSRWSHGPVADLSGDDFMKV